MHISRLVTEQREIKEIALNQRLPPTLPPLFISPPFLFYSFRSVILFPFLPSPLLPLSSFQLSIYMLALCMSVRPQLLAVEAVCFSLLVSSTAPVGAAPNF